MACCDGCAKSGGNCGGSTSLASHQAKLDARRHELAGRGCAQCTNFAWHGPAQVLVTAADGSRHHPSCPTIASLSGYGGGGIAEGLGEGRHAVSEGTKARGLGLPKGAGILAPGASLRLGSRLTSPNGRFSARLQQSDGNFVVYDNQGIDNALWSPGVNGRGVVRATMQTDGNFVLYNAKDVAIRATGTEGHPGAYLDMQNDGNLVLYAANGQSLWSMFAVWGYGNVTFGSNGLLEGVGAIAPDTGQDPTPVGTAAGSGLASPAPGTSTTTYVVGGLAAVAVLALGAKLLERRHATR